MTGFSAGLKISFSPLVLPQVKEAREEQGCRNVALQSSPALDKSIGISQRSTKSR
jgi:hypothetical protein